MCVPVCVRLCVPERKKEGGRLYRQLWKTGGWYPDDDDDEDDEEDDDGDDVEEVCGRRKGVTTS